MGAKRKPQKTAIPFSVPYTLGSETGHFPGRKNDHCLLGFSGGKDSSYTLWQLRERYGLRVLAVTLDNGFISPGSFPFSQSILFILAVVVGGSGTILGPVVGAAIVVLLPEFLADLRGSPFTLALIET